MNTETLLKKCKNGSADAWGVFIKRMSPVVKKSIYHKLKKLGLSRRKDLADDILQEVFFALWEKNKLQSVRDVRALEGWMAIVSMNTASNWCRKHVFRAESNCVSLDKVIPGRDKDSTFIELLTDEKLQTSTELDKRELAALIKKEIERLPDRQKLSIKLNLYDGLKQREIAGIMNVPLNTVSTLIKRAKNSVGQKLREMRLQ